MLMLLMGSDGAAGVGFGVGRVLVSGGRPLQHGFSGS